MSMKAVVFQGPFKLKVNEVPRPQIEHPDDVIVKITTAAICGSDLHMYVRTPLHTPTGIG
jgi:threonine dehydrogenase-like Zn-dependent dehydrogenase